MRGGPDDILKVIQAEEIEYYQIEKTIIGNWLQRTQSGLKTAERVLKKPRSVVFLREIQH